jgi:hypothetical protein
MDKRFHGMKDELIAQLQAASTHRDEARGQVGTAVLLAWHAWVPDRHCSTHGYCWHHAGMTA